MKCIAIAAGCWIIVSFATPPANGQVPSSPAVARAVKDDLAKSAPQLEELYGNISQALRTIDRQRFDPQAVVEQVGRNPQKLFEWARDNTELVPYRGALRGPVGVLMDRRGNSLDRSLLLAEMLRGIGCEVRLANAMLSKERAQQLLDRITSTKSREETGPDSPQTRESRGRVEKQTQQILKLLGPSPDGAANRAGWAEALVDHWWVQRKEEGRWIDADLIGQSVSPPARNVAYTPQGDKLPLDPKDCHEVDLRIVIEAFKGGKLQTETVLKQTLRPAEMLGRTINLTHSLGEAIKDEDLANDPTARKRLRAELAKRDLFVPTLNIDDRPITDASFTTSGEVDHNPNPDPAGKLASAAGKTMGGAFGGLGGNGAANKPTGVLTAEWIEYEVRVPGRQPQTVRRDVFDLLGPGARAAGVKQIPVLTDEQMLRRARMLLGQTRILLQSCAISTEFLTYASARRDLREKVVWLGIVGGQIDTRAKWKGAMSKLSGREDVTPLVALIREGLGGERTFIDSPNIVHHRLFMSEGEGDQLVLTSAIDLALTSTAALGPASFTDRLRQGVADTLAEHLALGPHAMTGENAVGLFEASLAKKIDPMVLRPSDGAAGLTTKLSMPVDAAARVASELAAGHALVLAGDGSGRWAWWRVDPRSGQTVGVMDTGYNAATVEKAKLEKWIADQAAVWGEDITAGSLEEATPQQIAAWGKNIPARMNLLIKWQQMLRAITVNALSASRFMG